MASRHNSGVRILGVADVVWQQADRLAEMNTAQAVTLQRMIRDTRPGDTLAIHAIDCAEVVCSCHPLMMRVGAQA